MTTVRALRQTFVLHAELSDVPEIWRRLAVPSDLLLADLHATLQIAFDWDDQHLHFFEHAGKRYGIPDDDEHRIDDQAGIRVASLLREDGDTLRYVYDFGDWWEHRIALVAVRPFATDDATPHCLDGARAGPPEDCGGPSGYRHVLAVLADPQHAEYQQVTTALRGFYYPQAFSAAETSARLARYLGPQRRPRR